MTSIPMSTPIPTANMMIVFVSGQSLFSLVVVVISCCSVVSVLVFVCVVFVLVVVLFGIVLFAPMVVV